MESTRPPTSNRKLQNGDDGEEITQKLFTIQSSDKSGRLEQKPADSTGKDVNKSSAGSLETSPETANDSQNGSSEAIDGLDTVHIPAVDFSEVEDTSLEIIDTVRLPAQAENGITQETPTTPLKAKQRAGITRGKAILYISLLLIVVLNALNMGYAHFTGPQGWAYIIGGPVTTENDNPLAIIKKELHNGLTPGATMQATPQL
ncbi:MAG TPA: hypothetical protein VIX20_04870, partial [Ktedonobacteraceae bacterium]